ncbi:MAG: eukaryotic-like serine/threonine-protein kinase [Acidobacteriaceae bacterium]|jgi:serine/threonine-protein kinase|nr:eukaryotic-like serine/threonine-protein kinase [Acidobacteriaceae bacterium]
MKRREIEHYEILKKLGSGGSGVVYLANDTLLMRPVVLKILKRGALSLEQMRTTVLREARLASAIEHPNVCAIYEVGESSDEAYIVMQYVPGRSLDRLIAQGPANVPLVLSVGIQIADGLSAAHQIGIYHRDLKPANVMLTDGGLVKILDFGLARRKSPDEAEFDPAQPTRRKQGAVPRTYSVRGGTLAYMAPEQFVTGQSSVQSDLFAFGVILYELVSGRHPFVRPDVEELQGVRAIQFADPPALNQFCPEVPDELASVIDRCLKKNPSDRYAAAAEVREALKTIMRTKQFETGMPFELPANMPPAEREKRSTGMLSMLAERFRESADEVAKENSILVLPFRNFGKPGAEGQAATDSHLENSPMYGFALADAIAARLARMPSLVVRPSSALMQLPLSVQQMDPLTLGQRLLARYVLAGNFLRSDDGFDLNWQLLDVAGQSVRTGGAIRVASFDLIAVQTEISNEVFATLQGMGQKLNGAQGERSTRISRLGEQVSEEYLQARALLSSFVARAGSRGDLDRALAGFERVVERDPQFAAAWSGLGIVHVQYVRNGFGGQMHLLSARRAFDKALEIDSGSIEANLYRVYMMLSRGEKESARHGIEQLLRTSGNDWNVHSIAGITLRLDGMYEDALAQFNRSLQLNPSNAPAIYNHRARVYQYQNQLELAEEELQKGLTLEPKHSLLRTSLAYQHMRKGELQTAISLLETVIREDDSMRLAFPTLAMCYVQVGQREKAASLIEEDSLSAAEADSEMAYRLATYFAVEGDESEALHWLRRAIYLGNENYPWFSKNPAWQRLHAHADFDRILEELKKSYRKNQKTWRRLLEHVPQA